MTTLGSQWQQLQQLLQNDLNITDEMLLLLGNERTALETRNYEQFQQLVEQKLTLVRQLESNSTARQAVLRTAGFSTDRNALENARLLAPQIAEQWQQLIVRWQQCQNLNTVNERIAKRTKLVVSQVLEILRGQNNRQRLYNATGAATESGNGHTITSA